jgi:flagellar biosynthesis/type III secretory pathway protein FliH
MSALIKAGERGRGGQEVRPLPDPPGQGALSPEPVVSVEVMALRRQLDIAQTELQARSAEVERLRSDVTRAFHEGEVEGRKLGLLEAQSREDASLAALGEALTQATRELQGTFASLEDLAVAITSTALAKILDDPSERAELVASLIRRQLQDLESQALLHITVSAVDFADEDALARLASALGRAVKLEAQEGLPSGECRMKLTLGVLDVGLGQQRERLQQVLKSGAEAGS